MRLLPEPDSMVAKLFNIGLWKIHILHLGFLQGNELRLMLINNRSQLVQSSPDAIDIKGNNFHLS